MNGIQRQLCAARRARPSHSASRVPRASPRRHPTRVFARPSARVVVVVVARVRARSFAGERGGIFSSDPPRLLGAMFSSKSASASAPAPAAPPAGRALHLLSYDDAAKKFTLCEDALACLRGVRGPVGVLAVCGRARQGKSFILNQLASVARGRDGFAVGPTVRPCTKGLWIWSEPVPCVTAEGERYSLVLLDTEGVDAYDQTGQYSTQIFSLAVLLSSLFCYNQMGGIDEAALDRLSLVTEMTDHIRVRAAMEGGEKSGPGARRSAADASDLARFSPSFVWLLRDFYLDLADGTAADYLESALRHVPGDGPGVAAKNAIRDSIRGLFPERECFQLVRPVNDEAQLRDLSSVPRADLRPEFRRGLDDLVSLLFSRCRPKTVGRDVLNGPALAGMAKQYVDAINDGAVPAIATAWQSVAEAECRAAAEDGERAYLASFFPAADATPLGEHDDADPATDALAALHATSVARARETFDGAAVGGVDVRRAAWTRLAEDRLEKQWRDYRARRRAAAAAKNATLLADASSRVGAVVNAPDATVDAVVSAVEREAAAYARDAEGAGKHERLASFLLDAVGGAVGATSRRAEAALRAKEKWERQRADAAERESATENARRKEAEETRRALGAFYTLVPIRPRWRGERRSLRTFPGASLSPLLAFNPRPYDAFQLQLTPFNSTPTFARMEWPSETRLERADARATTLEADVAAAERDREVTERGAAAREDILREALETEKTRGEKLASELSRAERELSAARRERESASATRRVDAATADGELRATRERLAAAEREREAAASAAADASARRVAIEAEKDASLAAAEARAAAAERRLAADAKAKARARADADADAATRGDGVLDEWRAEARAAMAENASPNVCGGGGGGGGGGGDASARRDAAEAMTVAQLKHRMQVMGLAHLYVGKKNVRKDDLVDMFVSAGGVGC